eukprot:251258_1
MFQKMVKNQYVNWNRSNLDEYNQLKNDINDLVSLIDDKIHSVNGFNYMNQNDNNDNNAGINFQQDEKYDEYDSMEISVAQLEMINYRSDIDKKYEQEISQYGKKLFEYFCNKITWICINDYEMMPIELKNALLNENNQ